MRLRPPSARASARSLDASRDAVALIALALVAVVFFWPVLFAGHFLPLGGGDLASFLFPMYRFIARELQGGHIPLWNPHQYAGAPLVGDNQAGLFYPPNLLLFRLWPDFPYAAVEGLVIAHVWWAGAAMYGMLRGWFASRPLTRTACLIGALAFMLNDVFLTHLGNLNLNAALSWLPLALLGLHRAMGSANRRAAGAWLLGAALAVTFSLLAGHGQASFLVVFCLGVYALQAVTVQRRWPALAFWPMVVSLGSSLAAVSLLPTVALLPLTVRANVSPAELSRFHLPWPAVVGLLAPGLFGRGSQAFWGWWERVEVGYMGVLPWLLAVVAVARQPRRVVLFPCLLVCLGMVLALGPTTLVYRVVISPFGLPFRAPARFLVLLDAGLAMLTALGADWLLRSCRPRLGRLLAGASAGTGLVVVGLVAWVMHLAVGHPERQGQMWAAVLAFAGLAAVSLAGLAGCHSGRLGRRWLAALFLGLLLADLVTLGSRVEVDRQDPTVGFARTKALEYLRAHAGLDRIETATALWQPGAAQIYGLYAMDGVYNPLALGIYAYYLDGLRYRGSAAYDLLAARYIVAAKGEPPSDQPDIRPVFEDDPDVTIYENGGAVPHARYVFGSEVIGDEARAYARLHEPDHNPLRTVVLLEGQARAWLPGAARIQGLAYGANEVSVRVVSDRPGYLVLSDVFHPGWGATVDGQPVRILRADFAFRAVAVPAGQHVVRMWFDPPGWRLGALWTALTLTVLAASAVWLARGHVLDASGASPAVARGHCRSDMAGLQSPQD